MRRMKYERLRRGWNQVALSYRAKVPIADISRIECGRGDGYPSQRQKLARALQLDADSLLDEVDEAGQSLGPEAA